MGAREPLSSGTDPGPGRHSRAVQSLRGLQNTMLRAIAGVMVALVLRPISMIRTPSSAPSRLVQLYSIAGAKPSEYEEPDSWASPAVIGIDAGGIVPATRVLSLCWYTTSSARTQWRVRLYSAAASAVKESPGQARPLKPFAVPYTL